jgi:Ca2+-binding RTX toxin-like protein
VFSYNAGNIDGGLGDDTCYDLSTGNSSFAGGDGIDTLINIAVIGDDTLIYFGFGNDSIDGGLGDDTVVFANGQFGHDTVFGGDGTDTLLVNGINSSQYSLVDHLDGTFTVSFGGAGTVELCGVVSTTPTASVVSANNLGGVDLIEGVLCNCVMSIVGGMQF